MGDDRISDVVDHVEKVKDQGDRHADGHGGVEKTHRPIENRGLLGPGVNGDIVSGVDQTDQKDCDDHVDDYRQATLSAGRKQSFNYFRYPHVGATRDCGGTADERTPKQEKAGYLKGPGQIETGKSSERSVAEYKGNDR